MTGRPNAEFLDGIEAGRRRPGRMGTSLDIGDHRILRPDEVVRLSRIYLAGVRAGGSLRTGSPDRDSHLYRLERDGHEAKKQLVVHNLRLVADLARRSRVDGMVFDDHFQNGCFGLIRAVEKFDPDKGFLFSTYATWWIRQAIDRGIANSSRLIRLPVHVLDELRRFAAIRARLTREWGSVPLESLAAEAGTTPERAEELLLLMGPLSSLDEVVGDGLTTLGDLLPAEEPWFDPVERAETAGEVVGLLDALDQRERQIIILRFGLDRREPRTLEEVGEHFNLTRERIRQIADRALGRLRRAAGTRRVGGRPDSAR